NTITREFEQFELLKSNNTTFCHVMSNLRGKTLVCRCNGFHASIHHKYKQERDHRIHIGDIWTILEKTSKFKLIFFIKARMVDTKWCYINIFNRILWLVCFISIICTAYSIKKLVCVDYEECNDELSSLSFNLLYVLGFQKKILNVKESLEGLMYLGFQKIPRHLHFWSRNIDTCLTYVITSNHKVTVLHRLGKHTAFSCATHSIQSRSKFLILNGNIIQEHAVLRSNKQIRLLTSCSYCKAKPSPNPIAINVRLVCTHKAVGGTAL
ncbi:hypothetical protein ALC62_14455, partial [Cyphomyrmex costatus]